MTDNNLSDDRLNELKTELHRAVTAYHEAVDPGCYIESWVILSHKMTTDLEHGNQTALSVLTPTGQDWLRTEGILSAANRQGA